MTDNWRHITVDAGGLYDILTEISDRTEKEHLKIIDEVISEGVERSMMHALIVANCNMLRNTAELLKASAEAVDLENKKKPGYTK